MADTFKIRGSEQFGQLARRLQEAGSKVLRPELRTNLGVAARPAALSVRQALSEGLPKRGGLAALLGQSSVGVRVRTEGTSVAARITVAKGKTDMGSIDSGAVYHPTFGRRGSIVRQSIRAGLISVPLRERVPDLRRAVSRSMETTSRYITH